MLIRPQRGLSLVELMIAFTIGGMLLMAGIPAFTSWIQNAQNRTAAESVVNGLQLARLEAVRRSAEVRFELTDADGLVAWNVGCAVATAECPSTIQRRKTAEGTVNARAGVSTAILPNPLPPGYFDTAIAAGTGLPASVSFNGLGRPAVDDVTRIDITNATSVSARRYVVTVSAGGQIRMCDPALKFSDNPQGCS
ncbi:GspH/FimT family pseudopilin [Noviherbaspirillum denitrificans]|uniref:Type II secretion system protein H n=1 Tax=Noviherbaspirillum denitrificans TaxID=1968433 RepID=A0A254T7R2_9BURK|nr:GspH/FimT family pseudopilin [Noviherbaspirillum denitrificans]OWW18679.1 hypothetical protein AYR66_03640 [Noviherbaspirillum denitrificans]